MPAARTTFNLSVLLRAWKLLGHYHAPLSIRRNAGGIMEQSIGEKSAA